MVLSRLVTVLSLVVTVAADYACLCNYNVQWVVLAKADDAADRIGDLYEFDCKPFLKKLDGWIEIAFENKLGYVKDDDQLQEQVCQGLPSPDDIVTTKTPLTTTQRTYSSTTTGTLITSERNKTITSKQTTVKYKSSKPPDYISTHRTINTSYTTQFKSSRLTSFTNQTRLYKSTRQPMFNNSINLTTHSTFASKIRPVFLNTTSRLPKSTSTTDMTTHIQSNKLLTYSTTHIPTSLRTPSSSAPTLFTYKSTTLSVKTSKQASPLSKTSVTTGASGISSLTTYSPTVAKTSPFSNSQLPAKHNLMLSTNGSSLPPTLGDISVCPKFPKGAGSTTNVMTQYMDKCYEIMKSNYSFGISERHCLMRGGNLVSVPNIVVEEYIRQILLTWYNNPVWIGFTNKSGQAKWTSGQKIQYTNFHQPQATTRPAHNQSCTLFIPNGPVGVWEHHDCANSFSYICQYEKQEHNQIVTGHPLIGYSNQLLRCQNKIGYYDKSVQTDGVNCYKSLKIDYGFSITPTLYCYRPSDKCKSMNGQLSRPGTRILNALVPETELVIFPSHPAGRRRFIDLPSNNEDCETFRRSSNEYHSVGNRKNTGYFYIVCKYEI